MTLTPLFNKFNRQNVKCVRYLEALAVDNGGAALVVLLLGDPHLLEGGEGSQDGSSDPDGVLPLWGSDDLDLDGGGSQGSDLLLHAVSNTGVHGGASGHDGVGVQVLPDVNIALHDRVVGGLVDAAGLHSQEAGLEESLGAPEPLVADGDDLAVGQLIGLLKGGGGVAPLGEDLHQVVGELTASQVQTDNGVGERVTLGDGDTVGDTVTGVHDDTGGTAGGVQGEHGLDGDVHGGHVEGLEHDLGHLLPVGLGVEGSLSQEDGLLLGGNAELVVEGVVPDLLHVIPVGDDSVLHGVLQGEDTSLGLGLVTDVGVLLSHADHDTLVTVTANDGGEDSPGGVVSGKAGFAHAGAIVTDKSGNVLVTHLGCFEPVCRRLLEYTKL